jgi:Polyketide cyclase / dehydrase and lipid transport
MPSVTVSTTIAQPRDRVFDFLDDLARHEMFTDHFLLDWEITRWPATGVGASARMRAKGAGQHPWITITVVESVRARRTVEEGRGGKGGRRRTRGIYELAHAGPDATEVSFTNQFAPSSFAERLQAPLARSYLRRQNARALQRLKTILEAGA